jgi:CHAT domain-containing protein
MMELAIVADPVFRMDDHRNRNHPDTIPKGQATDLLRSSMEVNLRSLERLPNSGREARRLLELLPAGAPFFLATGFDAHRGAILDGSMETARRLHFATHGLPNNRHPELSALVLSRYNRQGQAIEALLRARDLAGLELCADLVVLSACRTALGHEISGEGLVGLTQAFFLAGAKRVVASYWSVNDAATAELMIRFYEGHLKKGMAPAAALRRAQLGILRETAWKAPSHWAAFALQGTWKR